MRHVFLLLLCVACTVQADWQPIFNGDNLEGWRTYQKESANDQWVALDGELRLLGRGGGDLIYDTKFEDFEVSIDWQISEGGNSGIFFLADESADRIYFNAPEVQILDDARHPDRKLATHRSGSLYDMIASPAESQKPAGDWNSTRVRVVNKELSIWHNGHLVTQMDIGSNDWNTLVANSKFKNWQGFGRNTKGYIGLQDHGDPVAFKNIKIRDVSK